MSRKTNRLRRRLESEREALNAIIRRKDDRILDLTIKNSRLALEVAALKHERETSDAAFVVCRRRRKGRFPRDLYVFEVTIDGRWFGEHLCAASNKSEFCNVDGVICELQQEFRSALDKLVTEKLFQ